MFTEYLLTQVSPQTDTLSGFCLALAVPLPEVGAHLVTDVPLFRERDLHAKKNPEYLLDQSSCSWTLPTSNPITSLQPHPCFRLPARTYQTPPTFLLCLSPSTEWEETQTVESTALHISCVTLGKFIHLSESHLENEENNSFTRPQRKFNGWCVSWAYRSVWHIRVLPKGQSLPFCLLPPQMACN